MNFELPYNPFEYNRRRTHETDKIGNNHVPVVILSLNADKYKDPQSLSDINYEFSPQLDKWNMFTFYILLPAALPFLGNFTSIAQFWTAREYFRFITGLMLWIGLFFEFPLVVYILTSIGFVKPRILVQQWRLAVIIIAIIAAAVTPTVDPVNMGLVMLPLTMLYFISIGLSYIAYAGRRRRAEQSALSEGESV